jgi:uncharacterized membrane protein
MSATSAQKFSEAPLTSNDNASCFQSMFALFSPIFALMIVATQRNKKNAYLRFHAFQGLYYILAVIALGITVVILAGGSMILAFILPIDSALVGLLFVGFGALVYIAAGAIVLVLEIMMIIAVFKAFSGSAYRIPMIGKMAQKSATKYVA